MSSLDIYHHGKELLQYIYIVRLRLNLAVLKYTFQDVSRHLENLSARVLSYRHISKENQPGKEIKVAPQ